MKRKAQIYENGQFFYHEDLGLEPPDSLNGSTPGDTFAGTSNSTIVDTHLGAQTIYQTDAPLDLKVVSWAPGSLFSTVKSYAYSTASGKETIIYVIENGVDGRNRVNANRKPRR